MSEYTIFSLKHEIREFCPIQIFINDEEVWTDNVDLTDIDEETADKMLRENYQQYKNVLDRNDIVKSITFDIVHYHHSIVHITTV